MRDLSAYIIVSLGDSTGSQFMALAYISSDFCSILIRIHALFD